MIEVVDAIMGSGKTSAAIQFMNDHPGKRFLYITPFIEETKRIQRACPALEFAAPSDRLRQYGYRKGNHLKALAEQGRNIVTTHALFTQCDSQAIGLLREAGYTIFIDEVIEVIEPVNITAGDMRILMGMGALKDAGKRGGMPYGFIGVVDDAVYDGAALSWVIDLARTGRLTYSRLDERGGYRFYATTVNPELFELSDEMYVLTYLFDGMPMKAMLDAQHIPYELIGAGLCEDGCYRFMSDPRMPPHVGGLASKIHICEHEKLNAVGELPSSLSVNWTKQAVESGEIEILRRDFSNFFRNICPRWAGADKRLWSVFKVAEDSVRGGGYMRRNIPWNCRATNAFRDCVALAYGVNIYLNPGVAAYFARYGSRIDADKYALANMVQWIFRSAIRKGEEIWLYLPSSRMRGLLRGWLDELAGEVR